MNYADDIWQIFYLVNSIKKIKNLNKIYVISKYEKTLLLDAIKQYFPNKLGKFIQVRGYYVLNNKTKIKLMFLSNLFNSFMCSILYFFVKLKKYDLIKNLYFAHFPNHWDISNSKYKILGNYSKENFFLISILRNNSNLFNNFNNFFLSLKLKKINAIFLESFLNPIEILGIYFSSLKIKKDKKIKYLLKQIGLDFAFEEISLNYKYLEYTRNKTLRKSLKKICLKYKFKKIIYPFFEFLDGKILSSFFNQKVIKTYSLQHAYLPKHLFSRFFDSAEILYNSSNQLFLPKHILLEQTKHIQNFYKLKKIKKKCVGAMRYSNLNIINSKKTNNYLLLMDLHNKDYLIDQINNFFPENIRFYVRPHPLYKKHFEKLSLNKNVFFDNELSVRSSIKKNNIGKVITTNYTSSFIDILNSNLVITILNVKNFMRDDKELKKYFPVINSLAELNLKNFSNSNNKLSNFISYYGNTSITKFKKYIN